MSAERKQVQVVKSNHVIEASYRLSIAEQRIVLFCITQIRRDQPMMTGMMYRVHASQIAEMAGLEPTDAYRDLVEAADRLFKREITLYKEPDGSDRPQTKRRTRWVQTVDYVQGSGYIELCFGEHILPYLSGISENFTRYALGDVMKMTSPYAIRLYELLIQRVSIGFREMSLEDMRTWLDTGDAYPLSADFRRWVLDPSLKQINELSPLTVTCEAKRTGRRITHFMFKLKLKSKAAGSKSKFKPNQAGDKPKKLGAAKDKIKAPKNECQKPLSVQQDIFAEKLTDASIYSRNLTLPGETIEATRTRVNGSPAEHVEG